MAFAQFQREGDLPPLPFSQAALLTWEGDGKGGRVSCPFPAGSLLSPPLTGGLGLQCGQVLASPQQQMTFACS